MLDKMGVFFSKGRKIIGYLLIVAGAMTLIFLFYTESKYSKETRVYSPYTLLSSSWVNYKKQFINQDGRVIDYAQNGITTSEGQSYAMLRSVWIDDKETFDKSWKWTKENLKRPNDNLFGWVWGEVDKNKYGFLKDGGENSASDGDSDIALALILASYRWGEKSYLDEAKKILNDLWVINTETVANKRYLLAGNWAKDAEKITINPSYFAPYAWRIFSKVDTDHNWNSLIDPAYELLQKSGQLQLDKQQAVGLPPNWVVIDRKSGEIRSPSDKKLTTDYSFDAVRIPWRIALDYQWNKDQKAYDYLSQSFNVLTDIYTREGKLASSYSHEGKPINVTENPILYATSIGYLTVTSPEIAKIMYEEKILKLYSNDQNSFKDNLPYYEQNWLWFGSALHNGFLIPYISIT